MMSLPAAKLKQLAKKAKSLQESAEGSNSSAASDPLFKKALHCYDRILLNAPDVPEYAYYHAQQGILRAQLAQSRITKGVWSLADSSMLAFGILSVSKAIELDPDNAEYYRMRGLIRLLRFKVWGKESLEVISQEYLNLAVNDFKACISKAPSEPEAWLHLLALNVFGQDWDEAISVYGQCKTYIQDKEDILQRAWFGCLAFAFAGDPIEEEDIGPLRDNTIQLQWDTLVDLVSPVVGRLFRAEHDEAKKTKVKEILELIIWHENSWFKKGEYVLDFFEDTEAALKAYDKAIDAGDYIAASWHKKGTIYTQLHRYEDALKCYDKALAIAPHYTLAKKNRGQLMIKLFFKTLCKTKNSGE